MRGAQALLVEHQQLVRAPRAAFVLFDVEDEPQQIQGDALVRAGTGLNRQYLFAKQQLSLQPLDGQRLKLARQPVWLNRMPTAKRTIRIFS